MGLSYIEVDPDSTYDHWNYCRFSTYDRKSLYHKKTLILFETPYHKLYYDMGNLKFSDLEEYIIRNIATKSSWF